MERVHGLIETPDRSATRVVGKALSRDGATALAVVADVRILCEGEDLIGLGLMAALVCVPFAIYVWNTGSGEDAFGIGRWSARSRSLLTVGLVLLPLLLIARGMEPYVAPERYLPTLERTSAPIIAALDRFTAERGAPPAKLDELVPDYLPALPATEYPGDPSFHLEAWQPDRSQLPGWALYVNCEPPVSVFYCDMLRIVSTDRRWCWIDDRD